MSFCAKEMKDEPNKNKEVLEIASGKSNQLDNNSNGVKGIVDNLKTTITNKGKYILKQEDKERIVIFL